MFFLVLGHCYVTRSRPTTNVATRRKFTAAPATSHINRTRACTAIFRKNIPKNAKNESWAYLATLCLPPTPNKQVSMYSVSKNSNKTAKVNFLIFLKIVELFFFWHLYVNFSKPLQGSHNFLPSFCFVWPTLL